MSCEGIALIQWHFSVSIHELAEFDGRMMLLGFGVLLPQDTDLPLCLKIPIFRTRTIGDLLAGCNFSVIFAVYHAPS